jgi:hypothetical protein
MTITMGFREPFVKDVLYESTSVRYNLCYVEYFESNYDGRPVASGRFDSQIFREKREVCEAPEMFSESFLIETEFFKHIDWKMKGVYCFERCWVGCDWW